MQIFCEAAKRGVIRSNFTNPIYIEFIVPVSRKKPPITNIDPLTKQILPQNPNPTYRLETFTSIISYVSA